MPATSLPVTIIPQPRPALSVQPSGNDSDYRQLKNSLGNIVYKVYKVYIVSDNLQQIQGTFQFAKYDIDGNQRFVTIPSTIDPYQSSNAIYIDTKNKDIKFDGRDFIRFNVLPNTNTVIKLYALRLDLSDKLDKFGKSNFKELEELKGIPKLFSDFKDYL